MMILIILIVLIQVQTKRIDFVPSSNDYAQRQCKNNEKSFKMYVPTIRKITLKL